LEHAYAEILTPSHVVLMLEDLHKEGRLSRQEATQIQDKILAKTSAAGTWTTGVALPGPGDS
jgi:hypothetical protein